MESGTTIKKYYRVNKRDISFIRFIFEACDGVAIMTTICPKSGIIMFCIGPGREKEFEEVLAGLGGKIIIEHIENIECIL